MRPPAASLPHRLSSSLPMSLAAVALLLPTACAPTFLQRASREPGTVQLPCGAMMKVLKAGEGPHPAPNGIVAVEYEARYIDNRVFASTQETGPLDVVVATASPCWREALERMSPGGKAQVVCASWMAKGVAGPRVDPSTTMTFDLTLLNGIAADQPRPLPEGLQLKVVEAGAGPRPKATDKVKVHYEGRLSDGTVFDSSIQRGQPAVLSLLEVVPCWRAAVPHMRVGDKAEITCPPDLAYGSHGSPPTIPPNATLHFHIELLGIER